MNIDSNYTLALIYVRVSAEKQVKEGHGLDSQELRCRKYAKEKGYKVVKVFREEGFSGGYLNRPQIDSLFKFLENNFDKRYIVIIDDLSRLARNMNVHTTLRLRLKAFDARLESTNFQFEDTPENELQENITASFNQYEKDKNRRQVLQKMKARLENGYWTFCPPPALVNKSHPLHGKVLTAVEPFATIYREAYEKYANNSLNTLHEVRMFIKAQYVAYGIDRKLSISGTRNILSELLYTGYLEYPKWKIPRMKGKHEGFIDLELFERVQDKLLGKSTPSLRKDYSLDFPLRGLVLCDTCKKPLTASWNRGRTKRYPNYFCKTKGCPDINKSISRDKLHSSFESLMSGIKPSKNMLKLTRSIVTMVWEEEKKNAESTEKVSTSKEKELTGLIDLAIESSIKSRGDPNLEELYENKAKSLSLELAELRKNLKPKNLFTKEQFGTALNKVFTILEDPVTAWRNGNIEEKKTIVYMHFNSKIPYSRESGFGTSDLALPISLMKENIIPQNLLVEMPGIEPGSE